MKAVVAAPNVMEALLQWWTRSDVRMELTFLQWWLLVA